MLPDLNQGVSPLDRRVAYTDGRQRRKTYCRLDDVDAVGPEKHARRIAVAVTLSNVHEELACSRGYSALIRSARTEQILARREADFSPPTLGNLQTVAAAAPPLSVTDLQAVALDALDRVQSLIAGDDLESVSLFYDGGEPRDENGCRDRLGVLLRGVLPFGIDIIPERAAPGHTRADLVFTLGALHLPVEAKGQWHAELWTAAQTQLDQSYTRDWRAEGAGIYLVFWFGQNTPARSRLKGPPRGHRRPQTPEALREALSARIPEHRRGSVSVVVLDVSR